MPQKTETYVKLTVEEYEQHLRDAAAEGARVVSEDLREKTAHLDRAARVEVGLITIQDICELYDVCASTVRNWGIEPIDANTQKNLYRVGEIADQVEGDNPPTTNSTTQ